MKKTNSVKKNIGFFTVLLLGIVSVLSLIIGLGTNVLKSKTVKNQNLMEGEYPEPSHSKTLKENGDGTYEISLSVTGDADPITKPEAINVLLIYDKSSSMWKYWVN